MARVKAQQNDPVAQQAKLERAVNGAKDRVAKLTEKLHAEPSKKQTGKLEEHKDRTAAQLKQAELRLQDAEKALAEHAVKNPAAPSLLLGSSSVSNSSSTSSLPKETAEKSTLNDKNPKTETKSDAAGSAIERAKANAAAMATMSPKEKLQKSIASLEQRLAKAQTRLVDAEKENNENVDAFRTGAEKLEQKLAAAQEALQKELTQL
jgi:electron transport complex protein RnfC